MKTIILAGGKGVQPVPYAYILPKPFMPIDGMPILEILLRRLARSGLTDITLTVGQLPQLFEAFFQDGKKWGLDLKYAYEREPLGTAGSLSLIEGLGEGTFLVANGDVLTDLEFNDLIAFHRSQGGIATLAVYQRQIQVDLGVVRTNGAGQIMDYQEKPNVEYMATMGINMFEPRVMQYIPKGRHLDFPDLVLKLIEAGEKVVAYYHRGYWMDLGSPQDYQQAVRDFEKMRNIFLKEE